MSQVTNYGDHPALDRLIGPVKMLIAGFLEGRLDEVHIFSTRFINTMKQKPTHDADWTASSIQECFLRI